MQLRGFNIEHMPTKSANGGALLYIKDTINYKLRHDLRHVTRNFSEQGRFLKIRALR